MTKTADLLFELGTEELPPKDLAKLAISLHQQIEAGLKQHDLNHESIHWYATPRRLAIKIINLQVEQPTKQEQRRGPALAAAFDENGQATKAAEGFAKSCQTTVDQLETLETGKGQWLAFTVTVDGQTAEALIPEIIETALQKLPIAKRMRWGTNSIEFVRPVHWVVLIMDNEIINANIMGCESSNLSYGHRFHAPSAIAIEHPDEYESVLKQRAYVIADYSERKQLIHDAIHKEADKLHAKAIIDSSLLDEVTSINEWPVAITGSFDKSYLELPKEVLISSLQDHQKYFPLVDDKGNLLPNFITFANIESKDIDVVRKGNERVLTPRLNDARFFWQQDTKQALSDYQVKLADLLYQKQLGSMADKTSRVKQVALHIADAIHADHEQVSRAAELAKCDLLTDMVGEFPELQGIIGYYYALHSGEHKSIATAITEQYLPKFSGDSLPVTETGQVLSIADKIETIVGIFSIGQIPTGDKDPFGLKRAALGVLRIIIECNLDIDLPELISNTSRQFTHTFDHSECTHSVFDFMMDRLRSYYQDNDIGTLTFESVLARSPAKPVDFDNRIKAVIAFQQLPESTDLAAANKRISNILRKHQQPISESHDNNLLSEQAEKQLADKLLIMQKKLATLYENSDYTQALTELASLRDPIDNFFDNVMVMTEDEAVKNNRLSLLQSVNKLFLGTADISRLQQ